MKNQKAMPAGRQGFVPIIIILVVLLGIVGVYYLRTLNPKQAVESPTPITSLNPTIDSISNWKIYSDKIFKFSFNYPIDFKLDKSSQIVKLITTRNNNINFIISNDSSKTIAEYLVNIDKISETAWEGKSSMQVQSTKKTVINGLSVIQRREYLSAADITQLNTYFKNGETVVSVALLTIPGNPIMEDQEVYNQILSTFKFLDESTGLCNYNGVSYSQGQQFKALDDCNTCTCEENQVSCTEIACQ